MTNNKQSKIVTFGCKKEVYIFASNCGFLPVNPYKEHKSLKEAITELITRGIKNPTVVFPKSKFRK
jgi:hypothetical protein